MAHFLSARGPIMGAGWSGPGARSSAMNADENMIYAAIKAQMKWEEARRREEQGLPPLKDKRLSMMSRAFRGFKKML
ncbi:MAG: hypothetical protein Q9184_000850 [Pyrenodesmia sp. 2 TL-2023]